MEGFRRKGGFYLEGTVWMSQGGGGFQCRRGSELLRGEKSSGKKGSVTKRTVDGIKPHPRRGEGGQK